MPARLPFFQMVTIAVLLGGHFSPGHASQPALTVNALAGNALYIPLVASHFNPGWSWLDPATITASPAPNTMDNQLLAIDRQGQVHFLWDTFSSPRFIYHAVLADQAWSEPAPVAETLGTSYTLFAPVIGPDGRLHLAWRNWLGVGIENPYRILHASYAGGGWSAEEEVLRDSHEARALLQLGETGRPHVVTQDTMFGSRLYHIHQTASGWQSPLRIAADHSVTWAWPDASAGVRLYGDYYYQDWSHYSYWDGAKIAQHTNTYGGKVSGRRSQLDGGDNLHVYWNGQVPVPGGQVTGLYYQCLDKQLNWGPQEVLTGQKAVGGEARSASDGASRVALAWKEAGANTLRVIVFQGCARLAEAGLALPTDKDWELRAVALSAEPGKLCALARQLWSSNYLLQCAKLDW